MPGTVEATIEVLSTTMNTNSPELMAGVMVALPVKTQASIYLLYTVCRSLGFQIAPTLAASFLTCFGALRERKGASYA